MPIGFTSYQLTSWMPREIGSNRVQSWTPISIPAGPRDGLQFLQAICDELKKQIGFEIGIGPSVPSNNLEGYRTNEGIDKMSAQTAIERLLDKSSRTGNFVWDFVLRSRRQVLWSELQLRRTRQL